MLRSQRKVREVKHIGFDSTHKDHIVRRASASATIGQGYWNASQHISISMTTFSHNNSFSFYLHSRWVRRSRFIQFSWFFMFGSRWMRGVINLFFCRLFACVSTFFFFILSIRQHRRWRRGKMMLALFCDYDDEESLIIVTAVILISRQHLTCFMAQQFTRTLHMMRVRSFVIDLCSLIPI